MLQRPVRVPHEPIHIACYLLSATRLPLWLTGQEQEVWEPGEPGSAVKGCFWNGETAYVGGDVGGQHRGFAEPLAHHIATLWVPTVRESDLWKETFNCYRTRSARLSRHNLHVSDPAHPPMESLSPALP